MIVDNVLLDLPNSIINGNQIKDIVIEQLIKEK